MDLLNFGFDGIISAPPYEKAYEMADKVRTGPQEHPPSRDVPRAIEKLLFCVRSKDYGESCSGAFWYPPGGFQDWHTNSDNQGKRLYVSWSETGDSGMRWFRDGQVVDDPDKQGWNVRLFEVPCWHMVYANCWRFSCGWKV